MSKDIEIIKKPFITITSFAVLLGIVGTISYAFGYMYDLGYLSGYGLSNEYFTRSHQDYLFKFFYVVTTILSGLIPTSIESITYLILIALALAGFYFLLQQNEGKKPPKILQTLVDRVKANNTIFNFLKSSFFFFYLVFVSIAVVYIFAILILTLLTPMLIGQRDARNEKSNYSECIEGASHEQNCTFIYQNDKKVLSGLLIAKSDSHIAIWNGQRVEVRILKDEKIFIEKATEKQKTRK